MVACKVILAVAVVFVAAVQGRPGGEPEWAAPIFAELKSVSDNITNLVGLDNAGEYATAAKNNLNAFAESLKTEAAVFSKSFEGKASASDVFKESTKNFQAVVDTYIKNLPKDLTLKDFTEKSEQALKYMVEHGTEITKKAQGNTETEKEIKEFFKKQIENLIGQGKAIQAKIAEAKKA
ncbi:uncharacterized protein LOC100158873 precursor [Acyrthosiphon pisum]|uniref:ACYPI002155 protein n=1 Tax=Acyrthosiphon pisum TaxID=7029 RepID=A0A8R1TED0_ACYPI|nr:uncharacterized protein LOC100158873 precursor [Acyrthosiphon pisum]|eukprot:NP_001155917.1 uncharacterized protein LOC100158873 precursor [Acyrthosiphon pisum]